MQITEKSLLISREPEKKVPLSADRNEENPDACRSGSPEDPDTEKRAEE